MPDRPHPLHPRLWVFHLLALALIAAALGLGWWQLGAWQAHRASEARDVTRATPVALADAMGPDDAFPGELVGHPVTVVGTWLPESTFFVTGRENGDREGMWVVTPLRVGSSAIPVVRGWVPGEGLVRVEVVRGRGTVTGWLQPPEGTGVVDEDPTDEVLPQLRIADALHFVDGDLYGAYVVAAGTRHPVASENDGTSGLEPAELDQLPQSSRGTALQNLFYAAEWWFFAGFIGYVWWRWLREDVLGEADGED